MGGAGSGTAQASVAERRVLDGQLDALAAIHRGQVECQQVIRELQLAEVHIRRANVAMCRRFYPNDSLSDLEGN
jgi:hypothetical protein